MYPFDLPGPQFLGFYIVFATVVIAAFYFGRRYYESGPLPEMRPADPLLFACLRGGPKEVVRVATLGLIDRGLLKTPAGTATATQGVASRRIEREILKQVERAGGDVDTVVRQSALDRVAVEDYESQLIRLRLVPDAEMLRTRSWFLIAALAALLGVGGIKLIVALAAGRSNVLFLIILMVIAVVVAVKLRGSYRTALGDAYLANVRSMFEGLHNRASTITPGSGSRELLWLTALFGVAALPAAAFPFLSLLWPRPSQASTAVAGGCGTTGGGSGCGGGGGGGCGGCGGG